MKKSSSKNNQIKSVARAIKILDVLATANREMALAEIAYELNLAKSTVHGLISTLKAYHYVEQSPFDGKYRLGIRLFELGNIVACSWDVRTVAAPYIQRLLEKFGETVHLTILDDGEVLYIDKRESHDISLKIVTQVGMRLPTYCTGVGKVLLAYLSPQEVKKILTKKGMMYYTKNTILDIDKLERELEIIRKQGYGMDNEELINGVSCVAAPIFNNEGKVIAAISVSGHVAKIKGERFAEIVENIKRTALSISKDLGFKAESIAKKEINIS